MRQNPSFAMTDIAELRGVIAQNPWATAVATGDDELVASHYPVLLDPDRDDLTVVGHVGKPDDQVLHLGEQELLLIFQGPNGYISPSWYGDVRAELSGDGEYRNPALAAEMRRAHETRPAHRK